MKRILSLVLAMVMVLGSFSAVFAAEQTVAEKAGAILKDLGVLEGNASGDLLLGKDLKRQDAIVLLSRLLGEEEDAKAFPSEDLKFKDVNDAFYKGYIAWAVAGKITDGKSAEKFGFNDPLTAQHFATFLLRALGYEVTGEAYDKALETAKELGLLADVEVEDKTVVTRGTMAVMTLNALGTKMKDSTQTLADKLEIELPAPELSTDIEITSVVAIANNKVEVKVKEEVAASKADFTIVKKGSTTELEIKDVVKESAKVFVIETEALVGGTAYTVTSNGKTINFTGVAADTTAPTIVKLSATDTNTFVVEYSDRMDFASATDVENYTFNKDIKVVKATLNADRTKVTLSTDAAKRNVVYTLTVQKVANSDGKLIAKVNRTITATEDRIAPRLSNFKVQNNRMIIVKFTDSNGMNKEALENLENYSINDLNIISAKAYDEDVVGKYETVVLMTEEQTSNKSYTLTINNLVDGSVLANALGKTTRAFRGMAGDKVAPTVKAGSIKSENNDTVYIEFNDQNAMDAASLEDISNYVITYGNNEVLPVLGAEADDTTYPDGYSAKGVTLTTAQQEVHKTYRIEIKGVQDEFGNALKPTSGSTYAKYSFAGSPVEIQPPYVTKVEYVNSTKVILHFSKAVANATDPTNYVLNKSIGSAIKARVLPGTSSKQVELTTQPLTRNTEYVVTINNVEDRYGNVVVNAKATFVATASDLDVVAPSITYVYAPNKKEIHVNFDEAVVTPAVTDTITVSGTTYNFVGKINDGTTLVYGASSLADVEYELTAITNIKDAAGNQLMTVPTGLTFMGNSTDNVKPEVEYVEQVNVRKLKIVFNEPVKSLDPKMSKVATTSDTHVTEWYYTEATKLPVGVEKTIGLTSTNDLSNVSPDNYKFTPYFEDVTAPSIIGVVAENNRTVVVTYDEDINTTGSYRIYRLDDKNNAIHVYTGGGDVDETDVTIELPTDLKGDYIYYIQPISGARDLAGNIEATRDVVFDFPGTDVKVTKYITGVAIINAQTVKVSALKEIASVKIYEENTAGIVIGTVAGGTAKNATVNLPSLPVLAGTKYVAQVVFVDGSDGEYKFDGVTPDLGITLTDNTTLKLDFAGYVSGNATAGGLFKVAVYDADGTVVVNKVDVPASKDLTIEAGKTASTGETKYVVLYDINDVTRVLYAAKVTVQ